MCKRNNISGNDPKDNTNSAQKGHVIANTKIQVPIQKLGQTGAWCWVFIYENLCGFQCLWWKQYVKQIQRVSIGQSNWILCATIAGESGSRYIVNTKCYSQIQEFIPAATKWEWKAGAQRSQQFTVQPSFDRSRERHSNPIQFHRLSLDSR